MSTTLGAPARFWRISRVTALTDTSSGGRIWSTAFHLALPLWLTVLLWRGLYAQQPVVAGVTLDQAVTYAVVAALLTYLKIGNRAWVRDSMAQHIRLGSIVYWFCWPVRPARYHLLRATGDIGYAFAWALPAYAICLLAGAVATPVTVAAGALAAGSVLLGQAVAYLIGLLLELLCFWTVVNDQILRMIGFVQSLLSGGFAPLWFFPAWFQTLSQVLPFAAVVNLPMSIYVGRLDGGAALLALGQQLGWVMLLGAASMLVWRRAGRRIDAVGG